MTRRFPAGSRPFGPLRRRRLLQALLATGVPGLLAACGGLPPGLGDQVLSEQRLAQLLAQGFPYVRAFGGLVELTMLNPRLRLLPQENRFGTALDLGVAERVTGRRFSGGMDMDYGLRFDAGEGAIRLTDVRVNRLDIDQLPVSSRPLVAQYAPRLAELLLADFVLYRIPEQRLALARQLGVGVSALRVLPDGLRIEMAPQGRARAPA